MSVARPHFRFSTVENRVTSTLHRCERKRIVSKLLAPSNYRSPTLSETVRRCGHSPITVSQRSRICHINFHALACKTSESAGAAPSPFLDGPKSAPPPARVHLCASIGVTRYPRSGKLPAPSRHRSPTFSQTARDSRLSPTAASRWSKSVAPATCAKLACMQSPV